jgi:hypothetical protein
VHSMAREARGLSGREVVPTDLVLIGGGGAPVMREHLESLGWSKVAPGAFFTRQIQAPLFPMFIKGVPAALTMEKRNAQTRLVLRLWRSNHRLHGTPAWVGSVLWERQEPRIFGFPVYQISPDIDAAMEGFARQIQDAFCVEWIPGFRQRGLYMWSHPFFTHGAVLVASQAPCP